MCTNNVSSHQTVGLLIYYSNACFEFGLCLLNIIPTNAKLKGMSLANVFSFFLFVFFPSHTFSHTHTQIQATMKPTSVWCEKKEI